MFNFARFELLIFIDSKRIKTQATAVRRVSLRFSLGVSISVTLVLPLPTDKPQSSAKTENNPYKTNCLNPISVRPAEFTAAVRSVKFIAYSIMPRDITPKKAAEIFRQSGNLCMPLGLSSSVGF